MDTCFLLGAYMSQTNTSLEGATLQTTATTQSIHVNLSCKLLGLHDKEHTSQITKALGIMLIHGPMDMCKECAIAKVKQKNATYESQECGKCTVFNKKVYINLSTVYGSSQK